ncbi:MAG: alginate export family protein [Longimicrobiales bacterium]
MMERWLGTALAVLFLATPAMAQQLEFGGEVRPRFEIRDPVLTAGALGTQEFTSMRTRASLSVTLDRDVRSFVQFQDVRMFGEETSTMDRQADGLDLHQGWVEIGHAETSDWSIRVGRQEAIYGDQRLVGAVNWAQQARSFDGARVRFRPSSTAVVDGLAFRVSDADFGGADESLYGLYSTLTAAGAVDVYALLNTYALSGIARDRYTLGGSWISSQGPVVWRVQAAYQGGAIESQLTARDISAFMVGGRIGTELADGIEATLWYDYLSGDDDPADDVNRVFSTLFATNHKFYGYMDFFTDIPNHTAQRGLQDLAVKGSYDLGEGRLVGADLHSFHLAAADGVASSHIGEELDLTYRMTYAPGVSLTAGASYFMAADAWSTVLANPDENQVWGYLMLDVMF